MITLTYCRKNGSGYYKKQFQLYYSDDKSAIISAQRILLNIFNTTVNFDFTKIPKGKCGEYILYNDKKNYLLLYHINPEKTPQIEAGQLLMLINRNSSMTNLETIKKQNKRHEKELFKLGYRFKDVYDTCSSSPIINAPDLMKKGLPKQCGPFKPVSYPFLILRTLERANNSPLTQNEIKNAILETYQTSIPRETIGKQLRILLEYGYPIKHETQKGGYWLG